MVKKLKGNNTQMGSKGVILATDNADLESYVPKSTDVGAIVIQVDTGLSYTVVPGPPPQLAALGVNPLSGAVTVDGVRGNDDEGGIGNGVPFKTMQAAADAIAADNLTQGPRTGYTLYPAPWQQFDEELVVDVSNALHLAIITQGGWMLGDFSAPIWRPPSGVGRNLLLVGDGNPVDGIRPSVSIQTAAYAGWNPTSHEAFAGPRISGRIDPSGVTGGNLEFAFEGEVFGEGSGEALTAGTALVSAYFREVRFKKPVTGMNLNLFRAWGCRFQGLVTCSGYSGLFDCELEAGMTAAGLGGVPPEGFYNCDMQGAFTGPASAWLRLDAASNFMFKANGASIVGGGSKVIVGDLTP